MSLGSLFKILTKWFRFYIRYRANKTHFLRSLGVQIGSGCEIITDLRNFPGEPWLIKLGERVTLAHGVILNIHDGSSRVFRTRYPDMNPLGNMFSPIIIGDNFFIGVNTIILPGVKIGSNCIVAAGSVVTRNIPDDTLVAGNPARIVSSIEDYVGRYRLKMIPIQATNRLDLR